MRFDVKIKKFKSIITFCISEDNIVLFLKTLLLKEALCFAVTIMNISQGILPEIIKYHNITRKITRHVHFPTQKYYRPQPSAASILCDHGCNPIDSIISIDDTSLTTFMYRTYINCELEERCIQVTDNNRVFTKHTLC